MKKSRLKKLIKVENRINQIVKDDLGLYTYPVEFDIVPPQKMIEIMAFKLPTNISNWKYGRDYEKYRTIYEYNGHLPLEVVINSNPARAYLMNTNKFAEQCLVIAHVMGHVAFFSNNKYFRNSRQDILGIMAEASKRFNEYERKYGIDAVEKIVDAGHAIQFHSSPFAGEETEKDKRKRVFQQKKRALHIRGGDFKDVLSLNKKEINEDIELYNHKLWKDLKTQSPVEPTEDILRYVIDNADLESWQVDILEVLRIEGQYFWPMYKTQQMNEGMATIVHTKIMDKLYREGFLTQSDHADFVYTNSLVKTPTVGRLNPYLLGFCVWEDIENRWNRGKYGEDWNLCVNRQEKENWDTQEMKGWDKCKEIMKSYFDWFFLHEFLTEDVVREAKLFLFKAVDKPLHIDYVITDDEAKEIKRHITNMFAQSVFPAIEVVSMSGFPSITRQGTLVLKHKFDGYPLDETYAKETMKHIYTLWGYPIHLLSIDNQGEVIKEFVFPDTKE